MNKTFRYARVFGVYARRWMFTRSMSLFDVLMLVAAITAFLTDKIGVGTYFGILIVGTAVSVAASVKWGDK